MHQLIAYARVNGRSEERGTSEGKNLLSFAFRAARVLSLQTLTIVVSSITSLLLIINYHAIRLA